MCDEDHILLAVLKDATNYGKDSLRGRGGGGLDPKGLEVSSVTAMFPSGEQLREGAGPAVPPKLGSTQRMGYSEWMQATSKALKSCDSSEDTQESYFLWWRLGFSCI